MHRNYKRTAAIASLEYVTDGSPGIIRAKYGARFTYTFNGVTVKDKEILTTD